MASIYQQLLGSQFNSLPHALATFHSLQGVHRCHGRATVVGASRLWIRAIARLLNLPTASQEVRIDFTLTANDTIEIWQRKFGTQIMHSTLRVKDGYLLERVGPMMLHSTLEWTGTTLKMRIVKASISFISFPVWCLPDIIADETSSDNTLYFTIDVRWKWLGTLVGYKGYLELATFQELI